MFDISTLLDARGRVSASKVSRLTNSQREEILTFNKELESDDIVEHLYWIANTLSSYPKHCKQCGKPNRQFESFSKGYKGFFCSNSCARNSPDHRTKVKATLKSKYGVDSIWQIPEVVARRKETCIARYGEDSTLTLARDAFKAQHDVEHVSAAHGILDKRLATIKSRELTKLSEMYPFFSIDASSYIGYRDMVQFSCLRCGLTHTDRPKNIRCQVCDKGPARSKTETLILDTLRNMGINEQCLQNKKCDNGLYPDLWFRDKNLVVEIDGNYWHAEGRGGDKLKSYRKKKQYAADGFNSLFFFEDECLNHPNKVAALIAAKLGHFTAQYRASKCNVRAISPAESAGFLNNYHLQGSCGSSYQYGIFFEDELLGVATFGKPRFNKKVEMELIRLCFKPTVKIHGGASKLIKTFMSQSGAKSLLSYSDNRFSDGQVYSALGMDLLSINYPAYFYMSTNNYLRRESRMKYQKHKLIEMGGEPSLSEWENAKMLGLDRIYDCGSTTWILYNKIIES